MIFYYMTGNSLLNFPTGILIIILSKETGIF